MTLILPNTSGETPAMPTEKTRSPLADRALSDVLNFVQNCITMGLRSGTIVIVVDNTGTAYGITGFDVTQGIIYVEEI